MAEINEVVYPNQFDTIQNFPSVTEISESSGEDINRNRDAILVLERTLGRNPQIGRYTTDPRIATVGQRLDILENGVAEGRFAFRNLNVYDVLKVTTDTASLAQVDIGGTGLPGGRTAPVFIRGPLFIKNSGMVMNETRIEVPFISSARKNIIQAASIDGESLLRITDTNANPAFPGRLALQIEGNVSITKGKLYADYAIEHSRLFGIDTTPRTGVDAIHVSRGNYHTHTRRRDPVTGDLLNEVDPNPDVNTKGLIDHMDLLNVNVKTGQTGFTPVEGVAYHVTDGDDHDHTGGRGAQINHETLLSIDPALSDHVTSGDEHTHSGHPGDGGSLIDHNSLINIGFLSHADIDRILNVEFRNHVDQIDPTNVANVDPTKQGLPFHVPQGHVSDPSAHHTRYTDQEAVSALVLVTPVTDVYQEGRNASISSHIQAIGNGAVAIGNPHGTSAGDIGALEGFDAQGNVPDFTKNFLEQVVASILSDPAFNVLRGNVNETITGYWTFSNTTLFINEANTGITRDVIELVNSGSGSSIDITQASSASAVRITDGGAGSALEIIKQNAGAGDVISIINSGTGNAITIAQIGEGDGIKVTSSATNKPGIEVIGAGVSIAGGKNGVSITTNASGGYGLIVNQTSSTIEPDAGTGFILIDKQSTGASNVVTINNSGTGFGAHIKQNGEAQLMYLEKNSVGSSDCIDIINSGTGAGLNINQQGAGTGLTIYQVGAAPALGITRYPGGGGTEHCIQITNNGIGKDIIGNGSNWSVDKTGDALFNTVLMTNKMVAVFDNMWTASSAAYSTGALGFTPRFLISIFVGKDNDPASLHSMSSGFAIATAARTVTQLDHTNNDNVASAWGDTGCAGLAQWGGAPLQYTLQRSLAVTAFSSAGITITPSGVITGKLSILVVG